MMTCRRLLVDGNHYAAELDEAKATSSMPRKGVRRRTLPHIAAFHTDSATPG